MERALDILAWGNPCHDIVVEVGQLPGWGGKAIGRDWHAFGGGTEANVACTAARLGSRVALLGAIGGEAEAGSLRDSLIEHGVRLDKMRQEPKGRSSLSVVLVSPRGERIAFYVPMGHTTAEPTIGSLADELPDARCLYTMPYDPEPFSEAVHAARSCDTLVAIDVEPAVARRPAHANVLVGMSDIAFFNDEGFRTATQSEPTEASLQAYFRRTGLKAAAVTLGAEGAIAIDENGVASRLAYPAPVVDTTGAGDAFNGGFLHAWLKGLPLEECLEFGCATAAHNVQALGARGALPTQEQVLALIAASRDTQATSC